MSASTASELHCAGCGYGIVRAEPPARCPMCGESRWRGRSEDEHVCAVAGCGRPATRVILEVAVDPLSGEPILRRSGQRPYLCSEHAEESTTVGRLAKAPVDGIPRAGSPAALLAVLR